MWRHLVVLACLVVATVGAVAGTTTRAEAAGTCTSAGEVVDCQAEVTKVDRDFNSGHFTGAVARINLRGIRASDTGYTIVHVRYSPESGDSDHYVGVGVIYGDWFDYRPEPARNVWFYQFASGGRLHVVSTRHMNEDVVFRMFWGNGSWGYWVDSSVGTINIEDNYQTYFDPRDGDHNSMIAAGLRGGDYDSHAFAGFSSLGYRRNGQDWHSGWPNAYRRKIGAAHHYIEFIGPGWFRMALNSSNWDNDAD